MLSKDDKKAILELWSEVRPDGTEEASYPLILNLLETIIVLKMSKPKEEENGG